MRRRGPEGAPGASNGQSKAGQRLGQTTQRGGWQQPGVVRKTFVRVADYTPRAEAEGRTAKHRLRRLLRNAHDSQWQLSRPAPNAGNEEGVGIYAQI